MAYLHENREDFTNAVNLASEYFHILPITVERDYYVTMILRELSHRQDLSYSKAAHRFPNVIRRSNVFRRILILQ